MDVAKLPNRVSDKKSMILQLERTPEVLSPNPLSIQIRQ